MATLYTQQSKNVTKTWILMACFLAVIGALGYVIAYVYDDPGIFDIAIIFSIVMNIAGYWYSDKIALAVARAVATNPDDQQITSVAAAKTGIDGSRQLELNRLVENLAITAGLPKPRVFIINDPAPNAFATGRNKEHGAVAVTTGLLNMMDRSELEGVLAHELSHIGNRDTLLSTVVVILVGLVSIASDIFLRSALWGGVGGGRRGNDREGGGIGPVLAIVGFVLIILSPIIATIIQLAISRKREYLADASGALLTRYPEGLANALRKIEGYAKPMQHPSNAMAHLYISNPFGAKAFKGMQKLFMTHPPTEDRIKALEGMDIK